MGEVLGLDKSQLVADEGRQRDKVEEVRMG